MCKMSAVFTVFGLYVFILSFGLICARNVNQDAVQNARFKRSSALKRIIYLNGNIYTVAKTTNPNWNTTPVKAMVTEGNVIKYIGTDSVAKTYIRDGDVQVDLKGYTVLPGIHDIHMHPLEAGSSVQGTCKLTQDTVPESVIDLIRKCAPNQEGTSWVLGHGHSILLILQHIQNGGRPPKQILDEAVSDRPIVLLEETSHSVWVNSKALELANITATTPDRPGGIIMKVGSTNEPNGILLENEAISIMDIAMKPTATLDSYNVDGLKWALAKIAENGITSICDARLFWKRDHQKAWNEVCAENKLTARTISGIWAYPQLDDTEQIAELKKMHTDSSSNSGCSRIRRSQIKVYMDGIAESTTAAMLAPYVKNLNIAELSANIGMNYFTQSRLEKYLTALQSFDGGKGFDFNIHAIGDRGIQEALNAINNTYLQGTRHRITHVELLDRGDVARFKALNVIADFQVAGEFTTLAYRPELVAAVGETRADNFITVGSVADTGAVVTLSSDWDVSTLNPFVGMQRATERGEESLDIKTAVEFYTVNPAYAMRQENIIGSLEDGKKADFIVIDQNIMAPRVQSKIKETKVLLTVLDGEVIYRRGAHFPEFNASPVLRSSKLLIVLLYLFLKYQ